MFYSLARGKTLSKRTASPISSLDLLEPRVKFGQNGDKRLDDSYDPSVLLLLRVGLAGLLLQLLSGQRGALQLYSAAAAESGAQGDAAGDPLHPGAAAPSAAARLHQAQRRPDVHAGSVQHHFYRRRAGRILLLQACFTDPGLPHGDPTGQSLPR